MANEYLHIISSGSKGNAILVETADGMLLIDQGLSFKQFSERCCSLGLDIFRIRAILVTHEHGDHINGVPLTAYRLQVPVFASEKVLPILKGCDKYGIELKSLEKERVNCACGFCFTPFAVLHDAADPLAYTVYLPNKEAVTILTDTGRVAGPMLKHLGASDHLVLESNHDPSMLYRNQKYSWELKQRIRSDIGHLSNEQSIDTLEKLPRGRLKNLILAHLSEENNSPELVENLITRYITDRGTGTSHYIASQTVPFSVAL